MQCMEFDRYQNDYSNHDGHEGNATTMATVVVCVCSSYMISRTDYRVVDGNRNLLDPVDEIAGAGCAVEPVLAPVQIRD